MNKERASGRRASSPGATVTSVLALLIVICLAECATGSCLSYGHSCWGAHGKRSGKQPATAPDWYITRLLRNMAVNAEMNRARQLPSKNDDLSAIFQVEVPDDSLATDRMADNDEAPIEPSLNRNIEAKPMLDDDLLSKIKIWQIMRDSQEEK